MNAKWLLPACLLALALSAPAGEPPPSPDVSGSARTATRWNTDFTHWNNLITERKAFPPLKIGAGDLVLSGPLINGFRRRHYPADRSLGQKILGLPVLNLFVPGPMPSPPESGGRYFAWRGQSNRPWISTAAGGAGVAGATSFVNHEPQASLISIEK